MILGIQKILRDTTDNEFDKKYWIQKMDDGCK